MDVLAQVKYVNKMNFARFFLLVRRQREMAWAVYMFSLAGLFWNLELLLGFEVTLVPKATEPQRVRPGGHLRTYLGQRFSNCVRDEPEGAGCCARD